jgi:nitroimidazol reductase NimA-like FMN-containing flavoprotein (pyridoxamine 5'-phosphate oxidase superfamily)
MSDQEIDAFLTAQGAGVLSLAADADSHAVPASFGYDGDHLFFQFVFDDASRKRSYIEASDLVTFTALTEDPARSVVVRGTLERVPTDEETHAAGAIAETAEIPTLNVIPDAEMTRLTMEHYRLVPEQVTGRKFDAVPT